MVNSVHVIGSRQLGGADRFFIRLVEALHRRGHPTLAVTRPHSPVAEQLDATVEQVHLPLANKWDLYSALALRRLIRTHRPDVVQTYMGRATRLTRVPAGLGTVLVARLGGYYRLNGYYRHADAWVGNTRDICDYLRRNGLPAERVFHLGNFVDCPREVTPEELRALRQRLELPDHALVLFALGRLVGKKGFQDLLTAFDHLPEQVDGKPLYLLIAGDGPAREDLQRQAAALASRARVRWAGWQNDPTPYYRLGDWFVCPSRHEPLGNVILEAWAHGLPVVTTDNEGARELVRPGEDALLAPLESPQGLAAALATALAAPHEERRRLAAAGHATVRREHSEEAVVGEYLELYRQLQEAGRRA